MAGSNVSRKNIFIAVSVIILLFIGFRVYKAVYKGKGANLSADNGVISVSTVKAASGELINVISVTGDVMPYSGVDIYSKAAGRLERVNVDIGSRVSKGQVLAVVEHKEIELKVREAEAALKVAQADLEKAKASLERNKNEYMRAEELSKNGMISNQEFERSLDNYRASKASLNLSEAQANDARKAQLDIAKQDLENCWIRSPISGVVTRKNYDEGAMVYSTGGGSSVPLFKVEDLSIVKVRVNVPAQYVPLLREGLPAIVKIASMNDEKFEGKIIRISPGLDQVSRSAVCEVEVENSDMKLGSGLFAEVDIDVGVIKDAVLIPRDAIVKKERKEYAFILNGEKAHIRKLKVGRSKDDMVQVLEGIKAGEEVIVSNKSRLYDGAMIKKGII